MAVDLGKIQNYSDYQYKFECYGILVGFCVLRSLSSFRKNHSKTEKCPAKGKKNTPRADNNMGN